jgi:hypothetical protein
MRLGGSDLEPFIPSLFGSGQFSGGTPLPLAGVQILSIQRVAWG